VVVAAGGSFQINAPRGDEVLAFALPGAPTTGTVSAVPASPGSAGAAQLSRR
jgi:hypothetical protein